MDLPSNPAGHAPPRRPRSMRRTSTIDTCWPGGVAGPMRMHGHARDIFTGESAVPLQVTSEAQVDILASPTREILEISSELDCPDLARLVGVRGGGRSRAVIESIFGDRRWKGTPLHLLLDDFAGASLVAGWAWSRWHDDWAAPRKASGASPAVGRKSKEGVCVGFSPGASSLNPDGSVRRSGNAVAVSSLANPDDPNGWHPLAEQAGVAMRRARRVDVWRDGDVVCVDIGFQDSATAPDGGRFAVHEYEVRATADRDGAILVTLEAIPHILPFRECPGAAANVQRLIGSALAGLRTTVPDILPGTLGCTHLNDVLRSMADVPRLLRERDSADMA